MDNMDNKYDIVLDIIENPRKYTSSQLEEILSDPETRDIYNLLCKTESAIEAEKTVDVDAEWAKFADSHSLNRRHAFLWKGSRAASIAIIIFTSIVAIAAGIAITVAIKDHNPKPSFEKTTESTNLSSKLPQQSQIELHDSLPATPTPLMFEDDTLETIMNTIASIYGVEVNFQNKEIATLHLYYRLDSSLPLDDIITQLNTFEQINIKHIDNTLIIE